VNATVGSVVTSGVGGAAVGVLVGASVGCGKAVEITVAGVCVALLVTGAQEVTRNIKTNASRASFFNITP